MTSQCLPSQCSPTVSGVESVYYIDLELLSDGCLAAGLAVGTGDVDTALEVDRHGFPILRGRTLKGLLVEEAALILQALPHLETAAEALFGRQRAFGADPVLAFRDGGPPGYLLSHGRSFGRHQLLKGFTTVRRQTRISRETGAAENGSLRSTRVLRAGAILRAKVTGKRPLEPCEKGLFAACVASVRRIGLHRNEGWGKVSARLRDAAGNDLLPEWLQHLDALPETTPGGVVGAATEGPTASRKRGPGVLTLNLTLEHPLLFSHQLGVLFHTQSLPYIPGSTLVGAAAERYLARFPCVDAALETTFRRLFLDGTCRFLNGYPVFENMRLIPTPVSFRRSKGEHERLLDRSAVGGLEQEMKEVEAGWGRVRESFVSLAPHEVALEPGRVARMHHQRERKAGRPTEGGIYVFEALEAGQTFRAHVLCEAASDAELLAALLTAAPLRLGVGRNTAYGGDVRVEASMTEGNFQEAPPGKLEGGRVVVTLLSDYLGQNDLGESDPAAFLPDLERAISAKLPLERVTCYLEKRWVGGQVSKWEMPRPTQTALAAGSVVVLEGVSGVSRETWERLQWRGLGLRLAEGFGRIGVNLHGEKGVLSRKARELAPPISVGDVLPGDEAHWDRFRKRVAVEIARHAMLELGHMHGAELGRRHKDVARALISRLRQEVRNASSLAEFVSFLKGLSGKKAGNSVKRVYRGEMALPSFVEARLPIWHMWAELSLKLPSGIDLLRDTRDEEWAIQRSYLDALLDSWRRLATKEA